MNLNHLCRRRTTYFSVMYVGVFALILVFYSNAFSQNDPLPKEIRELKMGDSSAGVIEKISKSGSYTKGEQGSQGRLKLNWLPSENPNFKDLTFTFTEKDRLCLIRFNLKDAEKDQIQALKRSFFDSQHFLWDEPLKMKVKDDSILLYIKESGPEAFFDFSNGKTGERAFELFNRAISVEDKPQKVRQEEPGSQKSDGSSSEAKEPQVDSAKPSQPEKKTDSVENSSSEKSDAQPKKESE
jgi:hypothetical protein